MSQESAPPEPSLILLSVAARAHAQDATRGNRRLIAIDAFNDADLQADQILQATLEHGQFTPAIVGQIASLSDTDTAVVYGSGFEAQPELLDGLATHAKIWGNPAQTLRKCSDPIGFSNTLTELNLRGPETRCEAPGDPAGWLCKQPGQAGGQHVQVAGEAVDAGVPRYWQRHCPGTPHSLLFLADGEASEIIGVSQLLPADHPQAPYRWGGAIAPVAVAENTRNQLQQIVARLMTHYTLVGLNGLDFILDPSGQVQVLELNPRLVATCELHRDRFRYGYIEAHIEACRGGNWRDQLRSKTETLGVQGMRIVYAPCRIPPRHRTNSWPAEAFDRPRADCTVGEGDPLCTVQGHYTDFASAQASLNKLQQQILQQFTPQTP